MPLHEISGTGTPTGYVFDHTEFTGGVAVTATAEASANTIVTANAVTFDGSTPIFIEFWAETWSLDTTSVDMLLALYDGSSSIGRFWQGRTMTNGVGVAAMFSKTRLTPSAATKTYSVRGFLSGAGNGQVVGGTGGSGNRLPGFIRITRA